MIRLPQFNGSALVARFAPSPRPDAPGKTKTGWNLLTELAFLLGLFLLLYVTAKIGKGFFVAFNPPSIQPSISLDPRNLPYYAARSTLRMFVALAFSLLFTLSYGY